MIKTLGKTYACIHQILMSSPIQPSLSLTCRLHDDLAMSESDQNLDEIIVAMQISPIHYCDNIGEHRPTTSCHQMHQLSIDEKNTAVIRISSFEETSPSPPSQHVLQKQSSQQQTHQSSSLDPSSAYKSSKIRRSEYSMRGIKMGCSNPSQDSAFGSMTDGELSRASSFKLSSFQSVSSPIDEGVEDILEEKHPASLKYIDSSCSCSPCPSDNFTQSLNDLNVPGPSPHHLNPLHVTNIKETCIYLDPPQLIVNDHSTGNFIYTSSPIRKCATTEVFSQKYRVSSFEDMAAASSSSSCNLSSNKAFRSFEEEQRIESAFTPVRTEEPKNFSLAGMTGKERSTLWKDSFLKCNKNNLTIKSNESIYEASHVVVVENKISNEMEEEEHALDSSLSLTPDVSSTQSSRRTRSDRLLFTLAKFKQNAIIELDTLSSSIGNSSKNKQSSNSCSSSNDDESNIDNTTITSTTNDDTGECNSEEECSSLTESLLKTSSSHDDFRKFVKSFDSEDTSHSMSNGGEEKTPLLDGIEMLSITSSTDN